ncbi:uncharacterized protein LOC129595075 [Paramacrobiotus metropolitanus]|uniref:uncharacterized protein LOC129595075 n=1 Tax=Paramacrobiotus metropolitanus TaxID=2943436 RepID=UPI0024457DA6|nr:uncharacterized protein LOC129595075 [Paramacrobiotus metropolitanus]
MRFASPMESKTVIILLVLTVPSFASPRSVSVQSDQKPKIWDALAQNSGRGKLSIDDARDLYINAKAGQDYPNLSEIPAGSFDCGSVKPGFYADVDYQCQVIRRCDVNGNQTAYLCPNLTIFNQITLVCDWFYNVDCSQARKWYDYANSRLYQGADVVLLDNQDQIGEGELEAVIPAATAVSSKPTRKKAFTMRATSDAPTLVTREDEPSTPAAPLEMV